MKPFKIDFDISDYSDVLPDIKEYLKHDEIINFRDFEKGNIENCFWKRYVPTWDEIQSESFRQREAMRILITGVWIANKTEILWIPPSYYFALQYGQIPSGDMEFRLKRLKHVYEKIRARNNPYYMGTLTMKNRGDGETTMAISDAMWEMMDGNMKMGSIGLQSKTREDVTGVCWGAVQKFWQSYSNWIKADFYPDFSSGNNIAEKMQFMRNADEANGVYARNIIIKYYPCVYNAMDGSHDMARCILDEICKWVQSEFMDSFINYSKFIMPGFKRNGLFDMFSSPADVPTKSNEQVCHLWQQSNPKELDSNGVTNSKIHRIYSNPLDGILGSYDKFGDADPERIYDKIMSNRKSLSKDKLMAEIRAYPLNESEMFESQDSSDTWRNAKGINERKIYLSGVRFKDNKTKEPKVVFGNLEWKDGVPDTDVVFYPSDKECFDEHIGRFCFSYFPINKQELKYGMVSNFMGQVGRRPLPPRIELVESILGIDPYQSRYKTSKSNSNGAMVNHKFRDFFQTGIVKCPTLIYSIRPSHDAIFHEDCIKAAVFTRSLVQPESITSKVIDYFDDRGYLKWMLPKRGHSSSSMQRGDAPTGGRNAYLSEIIGFIDAMTNVPLEDEKYLLELNWFYELLEDVLKFDRNNTQKSDLTMAWGASLLGCVKVMHLKGKSGSHVSNRILEAMVG